MLIPVLLIVLFESKLLNKCISRIAITITSTGLFSLLVAIFCLDLAYFAYNGSRVTMAVFQWNASIDIVLSMIFQDKQYLTLFITLFILTVTFGYFIYQFLGKTLKRNSEKFHLSINIGLALVFIFLLFSGVRGSMFKGPLRLNDGTISKYQFVNQLTLNPAFVLFRDMRNSVSLMDDKKALKLSQEYLQADKDLYSPIARKIEGDTATHKLNVVVILMESMTANNMAYFGNKENLTPALDSLVNEGIFFENAYSSGIHTNNGIFSTLFSYPSFWRLRPLSAVTINEYTGYSGVLKQHGYHTAFFTTQDPSFDNISQFMPKNHFDTIFCQEHYPNDKIVNSFGVADHTQFDFVLDYFDKANKDTVPFFASILTSSNHPPIVIPDDVAFSPRSKTALKGVIEYADWSLGDFFKKAKQTDWYKNTVFLLVADHGSKQYDSPYDVIRSFNHVPMLILSDSLVKEPYVYTKPVGQIDAFPTTMGLLGFEYINNTFGQDVFANPRPYIYFSADDKIACVDEEYLYVFRKSKSESLYKYKSGDLTDYKDSLAHKKDSMSQYIKAQVQAAQWCITNNKTGLMQLQ